MGAPYGATGGWAKGWHTGTDFSDPGGGSQVVAVCQGRIVAIGGPEAGWAGPHYVVQQASNGDRFYYAHLNSADCKVGDFLLRGAPIGKCGWQGTVRPPGPAGAHLHLERRRAPYTWANDTKDWRDGDVK
jgi:murein DD-endopeptidase MepM/ murein hydrolase activator NlpD